jgi:hypothetical protein
MHILHRAIITITDQMSCFRHPHIEGSEKYGSNIDRTTQSMWLTEFSVTCFGPASRLAFLTMYRIILEYFTTIARTVQYKGCSIGVYGYVYMVGEYVAVIFKCETKYQVLPPPHSWLY